MYIQVITIYSLVNLKQHQTKNKMYNTKQNKAIIVNSVEIVRERYLDLSYKKIIRSLKGDHKKAQEILLCLIEFNRLHEDIKKVLLDSQLDF